MQHLFDTLPTRVAILEALGLDAYNGNHRTLNKRVKEDNIDLSVFNLTHAEFIKNLDRKDSYSNEEVFCNNSPSKTSIRMRILRDNLIEYKCSECGLKGEYNNKPLSLQVDHINGINTDNRLENLRFLCPNCHTQTETYGSKRLKKEKVYETKEERESRLLKIRKFNITKEELEELVKNYPLTAIGKMFGVTDNAVRKRCESLGIDSKELSKFSHKNRSSTNL